MSEYDSIIQKLLKNNQFDSLQIGQNYLDFIAACTTQQIPIQKWLTILIQYYQSGQTDTFLNIAKYLTDQVFTNSYYNNSNNNEGFVDIYFCIASHHLQIAISTNNNQIQDESFKDCYTILNKIDQTMPDNFKYFTFLGQVEFYKGDMKKARQNLQNAIMKKSNTVIPYLGLAQVEFYEKNYNKALDNLKLSMKKCPKIPNSVRLAMGYCFYALQKYEMAKRTFQRVLQLEPGCVQAILGLAKLDYKSKNYNDYFEKLDQAFYFEPENIFVLNDLLQHYMMKVIKDRSYESKIRKIAQKGLQNMQQIAYIKQSIENFRNDYMEIKSYFYFCLGFIEQLNENVPLAYKYYRLSLSSNQKNFVASYCLGQIYINPSMQQYVDAQKQIQQAFKLNSNLQDILLEINKPLGYLFGKTPNPQNKENYTQHYQKAFQYNPQDYESYIEFGNLNLEIDNQKALDNYLKASEIMEELNKENSDFIIQPEIYSNIGVLYNFKQSYEKSIQNFNKALQSNQFNKEQDLQKYLCHQCTILFNQGITYSDSFQYDLAINCFNEVIQINPFYLEAYNRLGLIYQKQGNTTLAIEVCDKAIKIYENCKQHQFLKIDTVLCLKGFLEIGLKDERKANITLRTIDEKYRISDGYSNLSLIYSDYLSLVQNRESYEGTKKCLSQFADFISKNLNKIEPSNIHSAHVLAIIMSEFGRPLEGKEILMQLKEFHNTMPKMIFNIAQIEFLLKRYDQCITEMQRYLTKIDYLDETALTQIALCCILKEKKDFKQAIDILQKLILNDPSNIGHRYNYYVILHQQAEVTIKNQSQYTVQQTKKAIIQLQQINKHFEYLAHNPKCMQSRLSLIQNQIHKEKFKKLYHRLSESSDERSLLIRSLNDQFDRIEKEARDLEIQKNKQQQEQEQEQIEKRLKKQREIEQQEREKLEKQLEKQRKLDLIRQKQKEKLEFAEQEEQRIQETSKQKSRNNGNQNQDQHYSEENSEDYDNDFIQQEMQKNILRKNESEIVSKRFNKKAKKQEVESMESEELGDDDDDKELAQLDKPRKKVKKIGDSDDEELSEFQEVQQNQLNNDEDIDMLSEFNESKPNKQENIEQEQEQKKDDTQNDFKDNQEESADIFEDD